MSFLNPIFLFALLTVAVPLLIYLLNLRKPKKVRFSTLAFFDSLKSTSLKRIRIKRWLLLAVRCLAIAALVMALSRPFLPPDFGWASSTEPKVIGILIDNSPTMERVDRNGPYIEQAVNLARELVEISGNDDRVLLNVTNGESLNLPVLSRRAAEGRVTDFETVNGGNFLADRLRSMSQTLKDAREPNKIIYLITDGQETQFTELSERNGELFEDVNLQVMKVGEAETSNIGFESVELEYGGQSETGNLQLRTQVKNFGTQTASNKFISFLVDDDLITQQSFDADAGESREFIFEVPTGESRSIPVELLLEGDELSFDNRYYAAVQLPETRNILVLSETISGRSFNSYLRPMLEIAQEEMDRFSITFEDVDDFQVSGLYDYDAVIMDGIRDIPDFLAQSIIDHVQAGAGFLLMPAAEGSISSYNRLLSFSGSGQYSQVTGSYGSFTPVDRMATPSEGHPVLDTIFDKPEEEEIRLNVPEIFYYYEIEQVSRNNNFTILSTNTGNPLLVESRVGNGRIIYSAIGSDPGWSNFPIKPFFAPLFFRTFDYLVQGEGAVLNTHTLGRHFQTVLQTGSDTVTLQKEDETIVPEVRQTFQGTEIAYPATEWTPGWLTVETENRSILFSVNQDAMESQLAALSTTELAEISEAMFSHVQAVRVGSDKTELLDELQLASFGQEIWFWFVFIAINLLLLESLISRHYKAESIG